MKNKYFALIIIVITIFTASCTRKAEQSTSTLLNSLPNEAIGFVKFDLSSPAYKRYSASPGMANYQSIYLKSLEQDPNLKPIKAYVEGVSKLGFLPPGDASKRFKECVFYISPTKDGSKMDFTSVASSASGKNAKESLNEILQIFKDNQSTTNPLQIEGAEGFTFSMFPAGNTDASVPVSGAINPFEVLSQIVGARDLNFVANKEVLVISTSLDSAKGHLNTAPVTNVPSLLSSKSYSDALASLGSRDDEFANAYLDTKSLLKHFSKLSGDQNIKIDDIPMGPLATSLKMKDSLITTVSLEMSSQDEAVKKWLTAFSPSKSPARLGGFAGSPFLTLSTQATVLTEIKNIALATSQELATYEPAINSIDKIKHFQVGVQSGGGASPFPEILLAVSTNDPEEVVKVWREAIDSSLQGKGMPMAPWQNKEINGVTLHYMLSPLGVGVYMAAAKEHVYVSSSEGGVTSLINVSSGETKDFTQALPASMKELGAGNRSSVILYLSYVELFNLIQSFQGTLAMFTGQANTMPMQQFDHLKAMGTMVIGVGQEGHYFKAQMVQDFNSGTSAS